MLLRSHRPAGLVVEHIEAARCAREQDDMGPDALFAADAYVEVARIPARSLQHLHLDGGNVLAVAGAALERLAGIGPEIRDFHRVEIMRPVHSLPDQAVDGNELLL